MTASRQNQMVELCNTFVDLFNKLELVTRRIPYNIRRRVQEGGQTLNICRNLTSTYLAIRELEGSNPEEFSKGVNKDFIVSRRKFEGSQYLECMIDMFEKESDGFEDIDLLLCRDIDNHSSINNIAASAAVSLDMVMTYAANQIASMDPDDADGLQLGLDIWDDLHNKAHFSLESVIRRQRMIKYTLIPKHIADSVGNTLTRSLYEYINQAQKAFIYGAPFAALALMRSVLEIVLRDHYKIHLEETNAVNDQNGYLNSLIKGFLEKNPCALHPNTLPIIVSNLHYLRKIANNILHDREADNRLRMPAELDEYILKAMVTLTDLIEGFPHQKKWVELHEPR